MEVYQPSDPYGESEEHHFDAFWRTLIYDTDNSSRRATPFLGRKFRDWFAGRTDPESPDIVGSLIFKDRKVFRKKRGYLGNACSNVLPGDEVFPLHGGRLPRVLREERVVEAKTSALSTNDYRDDHRSLQGYRIVSGDAYVHGICDEHVRRKLEEQYVCREIALI
ncbi:hypothetical protein CLAFUW4_02342 [Fulvia fulva]|uniref:Uncharacterized protein n=1 Tax=Passalora fulva TaxID=5499 RepID=A0A9Q8LBM8_PASFU|nr:uncharacterized protein CLAFUR5_02331 [Fulvia fulva]KAK4631797.1 hypothetical protein CLAFUR4_02337 [Fulvia fulva]KAK4632743.1 hypothetical protein CLAFUR0_02341 [Fulvia fulva]UJO14526.1 hypothetical protein CLAFUR5_02331 [Fulvia fulva]WPV11809.1 hypothetical protein CLAFUW4_02342 [Fulvia fulva]WPV26560.1 hypothetical protein CLAFUW7_02342 [Fulvia fulva]